MTFRIEPHTGYILDRAQERKHGVRVVQRRSYTKILSPTELIELKDRNGRVELSAPNCKIVPMSPAPNMYLSTMAPPYP